MKNCFGMLLLLFFAGNALAQTDPVLVRIGGKEVLRSEFERSCLEAGIAGTGRKGLDACLSRFIDTKLKVAAAEAAGLDTSRTFLQEQAAYRRGLVKSYLVDAEETEQAARRYYERLKSRHRAGQVRVKHIFRRLPQNIPGIVLREEEARMDSIYEALTAEGAATAVFDACVERFSEQKQSFWVEGLQVPAEFEEVAFGLKVGEVSRPFFTPQGIHIVKVIEQKELLPFEEMREEIIARQSGRGGAGKAARALVEKLKKEYCYATDKAGVQELLAKGSTNRTLFTLDGKGYGGKEFARFAAVYPASVRRQLDAFTTKTVLDYENSRLEQKHPELRWQMRQHADSLLVEEITRRTLRVRENEAELAAYFEAHRSEFHWQEPRYKGIVLHCRTKRLAKQVRKFLKRIPEEEWMDAIRLTFNAGGASEVQAEQGLFALGDNVYVDKLVFDKKADAVPVLSHPFTAVQGRKLKGPERWQEVREPLVAACRKAAEQRWLADLRAGRKVEIDQEVLKTVNNH